MSSRNRTHFSMKQKIIKGTFHQESRFKENNNLDEVDKKQTCSVMNNKRLFAKKIKKKIKINPRKLLMNKQSKEQFFSQENQSKP